MRLDPPQAGPAADARQQPLQRLPAPFLEQDGKRQQPAAQAGQCTHGPAQQLVQQLMNGFGLLRLRGKRQ